MLNSLSLLLSRLNLSAYIRDRNAAAAIEYVLMAAGIAMAIIVIVFILGETVEGVFTTIDEDLDEAF
jgi:Flp pilus assembly pilin Flp